MPSHYQIRWWYIVNWTLFSLYEDFSRKYRSKFRLQNDSNFGRAVEASYRFAVHDYLTRPRAYATISTAETCLKLINSSWPDGFTRITASYRCAAQGPSLAVCSPRSSWQAGTSCLPRISGELLGQEPWVVLDCCRGSGSSMNVWKDSLNYQRFAYTHMSLLSEQFTYQ